MKINLLDYKGKFQIWQDANRHLDIFDYYIGDMEADEITESMIANQVEDAMYYGVPAYIGDDTRINKLISRYEKKYNKEIEEYYKNNPQE